MVTTWSLFMFIKLSSGWLVSGSDTFNINDGLTEVYDDCTSAYNQNVKNEQQTAKLDKHYKIGMWNCHHSFMSLHVNFHQYVPYI